MPAPPNDPTPPSQTPPADPNAARDLGFGVRVAGYSLLRLLNKDGSFNVVRRGLSPLQMLTPYHALLTMGWGRFLALVFAFYLAVNTVFGFVYLACGPGALAGPGFDGVPQLWSDFLRAFFFSVETFGTIGYGHVSPAGLLANLCMMLESLVGLLSIALTTGLVFARFSRPTARILYSNWAVVAPYSAPSTMPEDPGRAFMFRCANARSNQLLDVSVRLLYSWLETPNDRDGSRIRSFTVLPLEFEKVSFFSLSWTVVHPIDTHSPFHGRTYADLVACDAEVMILITGIDETFGQMVHSRTSYKADEIIWGAKFRPMFVESRKTGVTGMDLARIHDIERVDGLL